MSRAFAITGLSVALAASMVGATVPPAVAADVIRVNSVYNGADADLGDGVCDANGTKAGSQCTLRAAIQTANTDPDEDVIEFGFGGRMTKTLNVPNKLPTITEPVVIDGLSAPNTRANSRTVGSNATLRIVLKGPKKGAFHGLDVAAPSTIRGLIIQSFNDGIFISPGGEGTFVKGNYIGTTADGLRAAPNRGAGVHVDCDAAVNIGGTGRAARNILSGNRGAGVLLCQDVAGTTVRGNLIGVGADNRRDVGNRGPGIRGYGSDSVIIGGNSKVAHNSIAYNGIGVALSFDAVTARYPFGVQVLGNSFFRNSGLAIDLDGDGVTKNDGAGDADSGSNHRQNYPVIKKVINKNGKTLVRGTLFSEGDSAFDVRVFLDVYKEREGKKLLRTITVQTNAAGKAWWKTTVPKQRVGAKLTATATNTSRIPAETSEFAFSKKVR